MNKLTYIDRKWTLTVDGVEVPKTKVLAGDIVLDPAEPPMVTILVDEIDIDGIEVEEADAEYRSAVLGR